MHQSRRIDIDSRVFTIDDLLRFAKILDSHVSEPPHVEYSTKYSVSFDDHLRISGTASEIFTEEQLNRPSAPQTIELGLTAYPIDRSIRITLRAGDDPWENIMVISSKDANWVNSNQTALRDALEKVAPQENLWKKRGFAFFILTWVGMTCLLNVIFRVVGTVILHTSPSWSFLGYAFAEPSIYKWWYSLAGGFLIARPIHHSLLKAWPRIEFNFGSPYLRPDKRRQKLNAVLILVILPIVISAFIELVKAVIT